MTTRIPFRKFAPFLPAALLAALVAGGVIAGMIESSGLLLSKSRRALVTAQVLSRVEEAHNSLTGRYFGEGVLGPEGSASVLSLVSARWEEIELSALDQNAGWVASLKAAAAPHYVVFGGETLTIFAVDTPPDIGLIPSLPEHPPAGWIQVHSKKLVPLFNPRAAAAERPAGKPAGGGGID